MNCVFFFFVELDVNRVADDFLAVGVVSDGVNVLKSTAKAERIFVAGNTEGEWNLHLPETASAEDGHTIAVNSDFVVVWVLSFLYLTFVPRVGRCAEFFAIFDLVFDVVVHEIENVFDRLAAGLCFELFAEFSDLPRVINYNLLHLLDRIFDFTVSLQ